MGSQVVKRVDVAARSVPPRCGEAVSSRGCVSKPEEAPPVAPVLPPVVPVALVAPAVPVEPPVLVVVGPVAPVDVVSSSPPQAARNAALKTVAPLQASALRRLVLRLTTLLQ